MNPPLPEVDLALVMIVRNEARCIERCLRSVAGHVDRVLVLDTGSEDDTIAIARACGALVFEARWTDDFSAARNRSLELARARWNLVLDADQWLIDGGASLRELLKQPPALGVVLERSESAAGEQAIEVTTWITRVLPGGVRYAGRIHEQPVSDLPRRRLGLVIGHDGYSAAQLAAKQGRNRVLLEQALAHSPGDPYLQFQLGQDHEAYGEPAAAADLYLQALNGPIEHVPYRHGLHMRAMYCLGQSGRLEQAIALADAVMGEWQQSPDYFFVLGNLFLDGALLHPEQALAQWLPLAEEAWLRCLALGDKPELSGSVAGRGSFLAAQNLFALHEGLGDENKSRHYRELADDLRRQAAALRP